MQRKFITIVIAGAMMLPALTLAQSATSSDLQSQIQALLSQIQALQLQLKNLLASSSVQMQLNASSTFPFFGPPGQTAKEMCIQLNRDLGVGSRGEDVMKVQEMLSEDSDNKFHGSPTGFFGPATMKAMMKFQMHTGLSASGKVGPITRGFFERRCGKGLGMGDDMDHGGGGKVSGHITAVASSSITIQNKDGNSVTVNFSASTTIMVFNGTSTPPSAGSATDLTVGKTAAADGPKNPDGSIQAVHIRVGILPPPPHKPMMFQFDKFGKMMKEMMEKEDKGHDDEDH